VVNGAPLHPRLSFVTLVNNDGRGFCPYRIFARDEFVRGIEAQGYRLVDQWLNAEKTLWIPGYDEHGVDRYSGFYFRRD
jgi:putative methyltransferase (TIGR04325 family)